MIAAILLLAAGQPTPIVPVRSYSVCLRDTYNVKHDVAPIVSLAQAVEACRAERDALVQDRIRSYGAPVSQGDEALNFNRANREVGDVEIDLLRHWTERRYELPAHSHPILFKERLPDEQSPSQ